MKQDVSVMKILINSFAIICLILLSERLRASIFKQELEETHLRWNFFVPKETWVVEKKDSSVILKTLNRNIYKKSEQILRKMKINSSYIRNITFLPPSNKENISTIFIKLKNPQIEFFHFYKAKEKKHIIDFWKEAENKEIVTQLLDSKEPQKFKIRASRASRKPASQIKGKISERIQNKEKKYRDYRYGASFVWDYPILWPKLKRVVDTTRKTPEYFYPIKNRDFEKNEEEAHIQLSINLYRKKKYGLMYKSIKLFKEKYNKNLEINEYLKINAILREGIENKDRASTQLAINMLINMVHKTKNYDLKRAGMKYLIQYYQDQGNNTEALKISKQFYIASKEHSHDRDSLHSIKNIFYGLAKLSQYHKIEKISRDKEINNFVLDQTLTAYKISSLCKLNKEQDSISFYEMKKKNFSKQVLASILYNSGEAYFRLGNFKKAIGLFKKFVSQYSHHSYAERAYLRIALSYDILNKKREEVLLAYKTAINHSQSFEIKSEAQIRYVGIRFNRKKILNVEDKEIENFLKINYRKNLNQNLKKLLWLTRLRSFINKKDFQKAISYFSVLPLMNLTKIDRKVFYLDRTEILYGLILDFYKKSQYTKMIKIWGKYKKNSSLIQDYHISFMVAHAYLKLGLYKGFDRVYANLKSLKQKSKTYPIWIERSFPSIEKYFFQELSIVKNIELENLKLAQSEIIKLAQLKPNHEKVSYYQGFVHFKKKKYKEAIESFESFLNQKEKGVIFDPQDLAKMMDYYTSSLYKTNQLDKFKKVANALLMDTQSYAPQNAFVKNLKEKLEYYNIEILSGEPTSKSYLKLESLTQGFLKRYPKSHFLGRVHYLLGISLLKNKKNLKAKAILEQLTKNKNVSGYIKELAKSELSLINIRERVL